MILGAGMLQDFVIRRAKELGYSTFAVDGNPQAVGFSHADQHAVVNITDIEACLAYAKQNGISGVLTAATDYGVLASSYIAEQLRLPGLPLSVAQLVKNKLSVRRRLVEEGVDGDFFSVGIADVCELEKYRDAFPYPLIVKPCDGSGSKGVSRAIRFEELASCCEQALQASLTGTAIIERFIAGCEYGVEAFVLDGKVEVLTIMKKRMTPYPYFAELGHQTPSGLAPETERAIKTKVVQTIHALGINFGAVNIDLILSEDRQCYIIDLGARMGGNLIGSHIVPYSTGVDYMGNIIRAAVGDPVDFQKTKSVPIGTALLVLTPGIIQKLPDFNALQARNNILDVVFNKKIGDEIRLYRNNLDGCGYVVATGETGQAATQLAFAVKDEIDHAISGG